ncbi:MAG: hypothetical protein ACJ75B_11605 [Flavisolibacter sp.]
MVDGIWELNATGNKNGLTARNFAVEAENCIKMLVESAMANSLTKTHQTVKLNHQGFPGPIFVKMRLTFLLFISFLMASPDVSARGSGFHSAEIVITSSKPEVGQLFSSIEWMHPASLPQGKVRHPVASLDMAGGLALHMRRLYTNNIKVRHQCIYSCKRYLTYNYPFHQFW